MNDSITLTGNVATEPEHKRTPSGVSITTFRIASGQRRYDRAANAWVESGTNFYSVSAFRSLADHAYLSLKRGDRVLVTGRLRVRDWENGTKRGTSVEIDAEALGHDLLWGTTTFVKDAPTTSEADRGAESARTWAAPGLSAGESSDPAADDAEWAPTGDDVRPVELSVAESPF